MPLPSIHRQADGRFWREQYDAASTADGKAAVAAMMLLANSIDSAIDLLHSELNAIHDLLKKQSE